MCCEPDYMYMLLVQNMHKITDDPAVLTNCKLIYFQWHLLSWIPDLVSFLVATLCESLFFCKCQ